MYKKIKPDTYIPNLLQFFLAKPNWRLYQLGLYQLLLQQKFYLPFWQIKMVRLLAQSKRCFGQADDLEYQVKQLLALGKHKKNIKYVLQEVSRIYPNLVIDFLENNSDFFDKDNFYIGLYLILCDKYKHQPFLKIDELLEKVDVIAHKNYLKSNLLANCQQQRLELLNQVFHHYQLDDICLIDENKAFCLKNFICENNHSLVAANTLLVTILVTAYNAQDTIFYCLSSLLAQTWQNLQIIVIDDASDDDTFEMIQKFAKKDDRIIAISLPKNVGTFAAKSIGATYATGEFLTCQDSDDWAHPQKIERQVLPLIDNTKLIATTSHWLRIDEQGKYYARYHYPLVRHNPASPLFRRKPVMQKMGLWHLVRTGADSEFFERLKAVYGIQNIKAIKQPLTLASHRDNSLMTSKEYGAYHQKSAVDRLDYWESWRLWHMQMLAQKQLPRMPNIQEQLDTQIFDVPDKLVVNADDIKHNLANLTIFGKVT